MPLALSLIEWGNSCFKDSSKLINERLNDESNAAEDHEFYWNSLILSIMQVNLNSAIRLLRKHSRYENDMALQQICSFIEGFQVVLDQKLSSPKTFLDIQRKLRDSIQSGTFKRSEQLTMISGLLIGKSEAYEKTARSMYENWFECLPSYTLFTCPGATLENIGNIAQVIVWNCNFIHLPLFRVCTIHCVQKVFMLAWSSLWFQTLIARFFQF